MYIYYIKYDTNKLMKLDNIPLWIDVHVHVIDVDIDEHVHVINVNVHVHPIVVDV